MASPTEKTRAQVRTEIGDKGELSRTVQRASYKKFRNMRRDPTLSLARRMLRAGVLAGNWSVIAAEDAPEGAVDLVDSILQPMRTMILRAALTGWLDYGWQPWERIAVQRPDGTWGFVLKALLQDNTDIIVDEGGWVLGLHQDVEDNTNGIDLSLDEALVLSFDVEGTDWYGSPLMWDCEKAYDKWEVIEAAAARYDAKIAGSHWVVYYPVGVSDFNGREDVDNFEVAQAILTALESSGMVCIPKDLDKFVQDAAGVGADWGWRVEILTDASAGRASFTERQKYLDSLKVRGLGIPERAILEGQFGTKAEAGEHGDFAIVNIEQMHDAILEQLNVQAVNWVLRVNYGPGTEGKVWVEASPLTDKDRGFFRELYKSVLANPETGLEEAGNIDTSALRDNLNVPSRAVEADPLAGFLPTAGQDVTVPV